MLGVAKVGAYEYQRRGDAKPQKAQRKQRAEGHGPTALLAPHQHVQRKEDGKQDARKQQRCLERGFLPLVTLHTKHCLNLSHVHMTDSFLQIMDTSIYPD